MSSELQLPSELVPIFSFSSGTLNCLKVRHCTCLDRRVCFCPEIHPFNMTSPFDTSSVCTVLFVCMCVIFSSVLVFACQWALQALAYLHWLFVNKFKFNIFESTECCCGKFVDRLGFMASPALRMRAASLDIQPSTSSSNGHWPALVSPLSWSPLAWRGIEECPMVWPWTPGTGVGALYGTRQLWIPLQKVTT